MEQQMEKQKLKALKKIMAEERAKGIKVQTDADEKARKLLYKENSARPPHHQDKSGQILNQKELKRQRQLMERRRMANPSSNGQDVSVFILINL